MIQELLRAHGFPDEAHLARTLLAGRRIVLYGAGEWAASYFQRIAPLGFRPSLVLDRRYVEPGVFMGTPAISPDRHRSETADTVVVVFVGSFATHGEIVADLRQMGYRDIVIGTDIYEAHVCVPNADLDRMGFEFFRREQSAILEARGRLSDELSRQVYDAFLSVHLLRRHVPIPCAPLRDQYFSVDFPRRADYTRTISLGGERGGTVREMMALGLSVERLMLLEPDWGNYGALAEYVATLQGVDVLCLPVAAFSRNATMMFDGGHGAASRLGKRGRPVPAAKLDSIAPRFGPTFLNMDIEGAEPAALEGARGIIAEYSPELAISVYHCPSHPWELLNWIAGNFPKYRGFYLRNYTGFTNETVLYCVQ